MRSGALVLAAALVAAACQSGAAIGTSCGRDSDCASPLVCRLGRCRAECTQNRDCPAGARCLLAGGAGSCSLASDDRCQSGGHACPTGLTCLGDRCVNTCASASDCPADGMCLPAAGTPISFCFSPGGTDAGLFDDAGTDDAGSDAAGQVDAASVVDAGPRDADLPDGGPCVGSSCDEAIDLCVGDGFACVVRADHHVRCWGGDEQGQLGDGVDAAHAATHPICSGGMHCATSPVYVIDTAGAQLLATRVACAESTACAVTTAGAVACWGSDDSGQAGGGGGIVARARVLSELSAAAPEHAVEVRAMRSGFCATLSDASAWCWGYDIDDLLALGRDGEVIAPMHVPAWDGMTLALGMGHLCGLAADGTVVCRGNHLVGELGRDYLTTAPPLTGALIQFPGAVHPPSALALGQHFSCALVDGDAWCWGSNDTLSIGRSTTWTCGASPCQLDPQPVTLTGVDHLWAEGFDNLICATSAGTTSCWGATDDADGCHFAGGTCATPVHVPSLDGARQIVGGARSLCAIDAAGGVSCFGANASGELGNGASSDTPTDSSAPTGVCFRAGCP